MSILRNKLKDRFVQVPNMLVTDTRISMPSRLVYIYLASKPDGWTVRNDDVKKALGIKDNAAMAKYWRELQTAGWITRKKCLPGENAGTYEYELCENPNFEQSPNMESSQITENPKLGKKPEYNNTDSLNNTELFSNNNIPPYIPPSKDNHREITAELKRRVNALFHRRDTTTWTDKETAKLRQIAKRNGVLKECAEIERLYNSGYEYRRRDIITFLNNWTTELDRARNYKPQPVNRFDNTTREVDFEPGF